jgi:hypothetical protein
MRYTNTHSEKSAKTANREELSDAWFEDIEVEVWNKKWEKKRTVKESEMADCEIPYSEYEEMQSESPSTETTDEEEELTDEPLTFAEIRELAEEKGTSATELWREAAKTENSSSGLDKTFEAEHIEKSLSRRKNSGWTEGGSLASESSFTSTSSSELDSSELDSSNDDGIDLTVSVDSTEEPTESELKKEAARQFDSRGGVWQEIAEDLEKEVADSSDRVKTMHDGRTHISITEKRNDKSATIRTSHDPFKEELEAFSDEHWLKIKGGNGDTLVAEIPSENEARKFV